MLKEKKTHKRLFVANMPYIDMHCDTITRLLSDEQNGQEASLRHNNLHVDLQKLKSGDCLIQNFAIFTSVKQVEDPLVYALKAIDKYKREMCANQDLIKPILRFDDIDNTKLNALLTIEDASIIKGDLALLNILYDLGVRMLGLNWNYITDIGYPNINCEDNALDITKVDKENGLTAFGKYVVKKAQRLGMIVDVSHLSDKGFWDVYNISDKPFVASHSNTRSICNVARNLDDEMISALNYRRGVMGLNFCEDFISKTGSIEDLVAHVLHIKKVSGLDVLALGSDFDGIPNRKELKDASQMNELQRALKDNGLTTEEIDKIFYRNALRVYEEILK